MGASEVRFDAFGTDCRVATFDEASPSVLEAARDRAFELHRLMTAFEPGSDVWRLNQAEGSWVDVSPDTLRVLEVAQDVSDLTDGAFDVTGRALFELWEKCRRKGRVPDPSQLAPLTSRPSWRALKLDRGGCRVRVPAGVSVDLGGIAKGYAADEVCRVLRDAQVGSALVDLDGSVSVVGRRPDGGEFLVGVQNPFAPRGAIACEVSLTDGCVVTSGVNERFMVRNGRLLAHVIDPRTGSPSDAGLGSATVVGTDACRADALATAMLVAGTEQAVTWARACGVEAVLVTCEGRVLATEGLAGRLRSR